MHRHLVEQAMAGDHDAFAELARARIGRLYAIAVLILRDPGRAEDATQEALVAAWRDLSALRDPTVRRLAPAPARARVLSRGQARPANPTIDVMCRRSSRPCPTDRSPLADRDEIERGFRRLDPDQRAVIVLHYYVGLPVPEVADALGIPVGTAKSRLHRATRALRSALDADARGALPIEGWTA